ncbi:hypothetical protein [Dethiothermospora halolimnae]|uniref:hypothetical protein n=1 Tax=Dethiothermospora halolimnae TaxID=3114390 RepID=UPI003CCC0965
MKIFKGNAYIFILTLILVLSSTVTSFGYINKDGDNHKLGDVIGAFKKADIDVTISVSSNNYNLNIKNKHIPTYTVNNELYIVAEDLAYYGYNHIWNPETRTTKLYIGFGNRNTKGTNRVIKSSGKIYYSDIKIYIDGNNIPAYNIGGYSLVKISDLNNRVESISIKKEQSRENVTISGKISLPNSDIAPYGGIKVTPVFYYFDGGYLRKYSGKKHYIPQGKNSIEYKIEIPIENHWNNMGYNDPNIYNYVGYEINGDNKKYLSYDMEGSTSIDPLYLEKIDNFNSSYNHMNINILSREKVTMDLDLKGDVFRLKGKEDIRQVKVSAVDMDSNKGITETKTINIDKDNIIFNLDLVKNRSYKFVYNITVFGSFPSGMPLPPSPTYPTFYYSKGRGIINKNLSEVVKLANETSTIHVDIKLPDVVIGNVYNSDKKISYKSKDIQGYMVNGRYLVKLKDIEIGSRRSTSIPSVESFNSISSSSINNGYGSVGKLIVSNYKTYKDNKEIPIYWLRKNDKLEDLVLVKDLEKLEYDVLNKEYIIKIK